MDKPQKLPIFVFDFGGVLLDWNPHYLYDKLFNGDVQAADAFMKEIQFEKWNAHQDAGYPFAKAVEEHIQLFPQHADLIRAYDERWMEMMNGEIQPSVDILLSLKKQGYKVYGFSNWNDQKFAQVRSLHPFLKEFDDIVLSAEEKVAKPDPRIFQILLDRVQQPAQNCLLIEDSPKNIAVARTFGIQTLLFKSGPQLIADLAHLGIKVP